MWKWDLSVRLYPFPSWMRLWLLSFWTCFIRLFVVFTFCQERAKKIGWTKTIRFCCVGRRWWWWKDSFVQFLRVTNVHLEHNWVLQFSLLYLIPLYFLTCSMQHRTQGQWPGRFWSCSFTFKNKLLFRTSWVDAIFLFSSLVTFTC